jgi:methyl-accepting chemotaxis protein
MKNDVRFWQSVKFIYAAVLVICAILLLGLALYTRNNVAEQNTLIYNDRKSQYIATFNQISKLRADTLENFTYDNTYWDDMVQYVNKPTPDFENDIRSQLTAFSIDAAWTYNVKKQRTTNTNSFEKPYEKLDLNLSAADLTAMFAKNHAVHYFQQTPAGLIEVFGSTVQYSDDPYRLRPANGYFFIGKLVTPTVLKDISSETQSTTTLVTAGSPGEYPTTFPISSGKIAFTIDLRGYDGKLAGQYYVTNHAKSIERITGITNRLISTTLASYVVIGVILFLAFGRIIAHPLSAIYRSLQTNSPKPVQKLQNSPSEFGRIARLITASFEQATELRTTLKQMSAAQSSLEKRTEELEKTNRLMMGRELKMIELKQRIAALENNNKKKDKS